MSEIHFQSIIGLLPHFSGIHYVEVPLEIVEKLGGITNMRLTCKVNDHVAFQCGLVALGEGKAYISITKKRLKEVGAKLGDSVQIVLEKDSSKYGMPVPAELQELFEQDTEAYNRFKKLTPGKQRYILYYVGGFKTTQVRIDKAIQLLENLKKLPLGKESFKEMLGK